MIPKLFISQGAIDRWVAADRADFTGLVLTIRGMAGALHLIPASLFLRTSAGVDQQRLLGKVKAEDAIANLGGEAYLTSVVLGDTAYEVEPGFVATPAPPESAPALVGALRVLGA